MKIIALGIDQGIASSGYGLVEITINNENKILNIKPLNFGVITTSSKKTMSNRSKFIVNHIETLINDYNPQIIGCEKLFFTQKRVGGRNKSASMLYTNMATGLLYYISGENNIPLKEFVPGSIKKLIAGKGNANKEEMIEAISNTLKINLKEVNNEHMADALSIAIASGYYYLENKEKVKATKYCIENDIDISTIDMDKLETPLNKQENEMFKNMVLINNNIEKDSKNLMSITGLKKREINSLTKKVKTGLFYEYSVRSKK